MKHLGPFFIVLGFCLAGFLTYLRSYDSILLIVYQKADAIVTNYRQDPPGLIREGDWRLEYEFVGSSGDTYRSQVTFAPKKRPPEDIKIIPIRFLPRLPKVSNAEGYISYTGLIGYASALSFIFQGILYVVGRKKSRAEPAARANVGAHL
jgi:hypothetical protein